jgi:F-type H+-transporting ATPase subunit gamma
MLNPRKIRRKIRSVKNIAKITRAMEMVSASKFKRVWNKLSAIRPYSSKLKQMTENLFGYLKGIGFSHPYLPQSRRESLGLPEGQRQDTLHVAAKDQKLCIIAMGSSKGLCGGYNAILIKALHNFIVSIETEKTIEIAPVGKKVQDFARKNNYKIRNIPTSPTAGADLNMAFAKEMSSPIIKEYEQGKISEVWLVYSEFINPMVNKPKAQRFLPFADLADAAGKTGDIVSAGTVTQDYLFEPQPAELLNLIIPRYLEVIFYRTLLEAYASEHSARMIAMRNASKNASEVIDNLTLTFNKARQANITRELLDIVGGAEGLR